MNQKVLLLEDVDYLGRSGDVVSVKAGYARNYIIPNQFGVIADKHTLRMQEKLKEERAKKSQEDRKLAEEFAKLIEGLVLEITVKVDPEGRMYGSVSTKDIVKLFAEKEHQVEEKYIQLKKPIKEAGTHEILLKLKEGVEMKITLNILAESADKKEEVVIEKAVEETKPTENE